MESKAIRRKYHYSTVLVYLSVAVMVLIITALGKGLQPIFDLINISLLYLLPVLISAVRWGLWPSLIASFLGILFFDYFFIPPVLSFTVADIRHLLNFAIFLIVALVTGTLAARLRIQADAAGQRERRTAALYSLSNKIAVETDMERILQAVADTVARSIRVRAAILMPGTPFNLLNPAIYSGSVVFGLEQKQMAMAQWVFEHGQQAGQGTNTSAMKNFFFPVTEGAKSLAVLALELDSEQVLTDEQKKDIEAFASLAALAITRMRLADEAEQAKWLLESEKLHTALLNAVSHDLRTPLSSIKGAVTSLLAEEDRYDRETKNALLKAIADGTQQMNRFIGNLLDMARLESGILKPNREWCDIPDIIGVALKEAQDVLPEQRVELHIPESLPLVKADFGLMEQVVINLLENAVKYAPPETAVSVAVRLHPDEVHLAVEDGGPSIPEDDRARVFDKFYRLRSSKHVTGTGLGLSICKGIVEAHGGRIWVEQGDADGNRFVVALPLSTEQQPAVPNEREERYDD